MSALGRVMFARSSARSGMKVTARFSSAVSSILEVDFSVGEMGVVVNPSQPNRSRRMPFVDDAPQPPKEQLSSTVTRLTGSQSGGKVSGSASEVKDGLNYDCPYSVSGMAIAEVTALASQRPTPLNLANMYRYASAGDADDAQSQRLQNAQFLHRELPIRIAQRAVDLLTLPQGLNETVQIRIVVTHFLRYLKMIQEMPCPSNAREEAEFTELLHDFVLDRTSIPLAVAEGIDSLDYIEGDENCKQRLFEMQDALYRFFTARVGVRFLAEHHVLSSRSLTKEDKLRKNQSPPKNDHDCMDPGRKNDFFGCIQKNCDPVEEARRVADQVTKDCSECYGVCPEVEIVSSMSGKDTDAEFTYVPHHLQYMLAELLKNSCRATVKR